MAFLRNLAKLFSQAPLTVRLVLAPGGVKVVLGEGARALDPTEVGSDWVQRQLPPPLAAIFTAPNPAPGAGPVLPLMHAQTLLKELPRYVSPKLQFDGSALAQLIVGVCPPTFRIHWRYAAERQRLEPQYQGADHHLGYGWFHQAQQLWRLGEGLPHPLLEWLNRTWITSTEIYRFVATILPELQRAQLPVSCDLSVASNFQVQLTLHNLRPASLEVRLTCNEPALLAQLQFLAHEPLHMISGTKLLPGLAPRMTPQIYALARRRRAPTFADAELAELLAYELQPTADLWQLDLRPLAAVYPLWAGANFALRWQSELQIERGSGSYRATPWFTDGQQRLPFTTLLPALQQDVRFVGLDQGWLELTAADKDRLRPWLQSPPEPFQLSVAEVLGVVTARLRAAALSAPPLDLPPLPTTAAELLAYLPALRQVGLPAAVMGREQELPGLFSELVRQMGQQTADLRVLWLVNKAWQGAVQAELKKAGVSIFTSLPTAARKALPGGVYLLQPATQLPSHVTWDLLLLHDFDLLAASAEVGPRLRAIKRRWALATLAQRGPGAGDQHLLRLLTVLQAEDLPVARFRQSCLISVADQPENWLARLTAPFKKILGAEERAPGRGVTIPRRDPAPSDRPSPGPAAPRPAGRAQPSALPQPAAQAAQNPPGAMPSRRGSFGEQARLLVNRTVDYALPVAFGEQWPIYTALDQAQLRWYLYWRTQARQGNFLPTDLSYLLLHSYEAINLVGFATPQAAFDQLVRLREHYEPLQPKLALRLNDWLADFLVVYNLPQTALDWYARLAGAGQRLADPDLTIAAWLHSGADFTRLNSQTLYEWTGYAPQKSAFYQQPNQAERLDRAYKQGLQAVHELVLGQTQRSLFDQQRPTVTRILARPPFADARFDGPKAPIKVAELHPWFGVAPLASTLQQVIKHSENYLRQEAGFRGRLRGIELPADWRAAIERALTQPAPRREITIDLSRVAALQSDADGLRERLLVAETEPPSAAPSVTTKPPVTARVAPAAEEAALRLVVGELGTGSEQLVRLLWQQNWQAPAAQLAAAVPGHFIHLLFDEINQRALEELGDALLWEEASGWQVNEEYWAGLTALFEQPANAPTPAAWTPPSHPDQPAWDPAWTNFAAQLQPQHWALLRALVQGTAESATLEAIARQAYSTANQLLDEINRAALEHVGDLVIDAGSEPPQLLPEAVEMVELLVGQWVSESVSI